MDTAQKVSQIGDAAGLSDHLRRRAQDRRQRSAASPIAARVSARSPSTSPSRRARRRSTSPRWRAPRPRCSCSKSWAGTPAGSPPPAASRAQGRRRAAHHPVSRDRLRSQAAFLAQGQSSASRHYGYCVIVVSEGVARRRTASSWPRPAPGTPSATPSSAASARWSRKWPRRRSATSIHWAVADYLQRSARHIASKVDVEQAYAVARPRWNSRRRA